jgi:histidinol-phosphate aminotransferase
MKLNTHLENLPVYLPGRPIDEVARELGLPADDIVKLASNENPLGPSLQAVRAVRKCLRNLHLYPDGSSFHLKQGIAQKLGVEVCNLVLGSGSNELLELLGHALLRPGAQAVASQYCFAVYPIVTRLFGAEFVEVKAMNFGHDLSAMRAAITPRTTIVFVANPNNPTGTRVSNDELLEFIRSVPEDVVIAMDEAYIEFLQDPVDLVPMIRAGRKNLVILRTFSKIYGLAGLRVGYALTSREMAAALEKIRQPFNLTTPAQTGALAALDDEKHLQRTRKNNATGLRFFVRHFKEMGIEFIPSCANFILAKVGDGQGIFEALQRHGVITRPMRGYGLPEWLRISIGRASQNRRCVEALRTALEK